MSPWITILSTALGGILALFGGALVQLQTRKRDHEARMWTRRADAYVALMQWRLSPPDDERIANPYHLEQAEADWREKGFPLLAELSLFAGPELSKLLEDKPYLFQAVNAFADMKPGELAELARCDVERLRPRRLTRITKAADEPLQ